jgi:hypothetical protein
MKTMMIDLCRDHFSSSPGVAVEVLRLIWMLLTMMKMVVLLQLREEDMFDADA